MGSIQVGNAVSINGDGKLQLGEGTTISKNIKEWNHVQFSHLHSTNVNSHLVVFAYDGTIVAQYIDDLGNVGYEVTANLPPAGEKTRVVEDLITLDENVVLILGSSELG